MSLMRDRQDCREEATSFSRCDHAWLAVRARSQAALLPASAAAPARQVAAGAVGEILMQSFFLPVLRLLAVRPLFPGLLKTQRAEKLVRLLFRFVDGGKQRGVLLLQVKLHYLWGRTLMIILIMVNSFTVTGKLQTVIRQGIDDQLTVVS